MRVALDTNILAYAEGVNGEDMRGAALDLLAKIPAADTAVPAQVLGELFNVLVRKARVHRDIARSAILDWRDSYHLIETSSSVLAAASSLAADHNLGIWDAVILSAAAEGGCRLLLSQDLHDGFTWNGVTVTNPFASPRHPLLGVVLRDP